MQIKYEIPLDWFVCPVSKEKLLIKDNEQCSTHYTWAKKEGVWNFIPTQLNELKEDKWQIWEQLQSNAEIPYTQYPERNLGVGKRLDFLQFVEFCNFNGTILDIGVGPQKIPSHIEYSTNKNTFFIGIDPLLGQQPRDFAFVLGLGEYLPFRDKLFDQVLYVTSLDHFIDPLVTLKEAKRVLKDEGEICIWLGEKDKNTPKPGDSPEWFKQLVVPDGAEDQFHFKRFNAIEFESFLNKIDLKIISKQINEVDKWRKNLFYKIVKL